MYIGQNIKYLRKKQGMTADELAKEDKTRNAITKYQLGRSTPPVEVIMQLSEYFDVSMEMLLKKI